MNVNGALPGIEKNHVFLHFANSANGALKRLFNENSLLRVDHLVVTLLQLPVNVNVLDVKHCVVLEYFIVWPSLDERHSLFVLFLWHIFYFDLDNTK